MSIRAVYLIENLAVLLFVGLLTAFVTPWALVGLLFLNTGFKERANR
jgi:hypothetical protein